MSPNFWGCRCCETERFCKSTEDVILFSSDMSIDDISYDTAAVVNKTTSLPSGLTQPTLPSSTLAKTYDSDGLRIEYVKTASGPPVEQACYDSCVIPFYFAEGYVIEDIHSHSLPIRDYTVCVEAVKESNDGLIDDYGAVVLAAIKPLAGPNAFKNMVGISYTSTVYRVNGEFSSTLSTGIIRNNLSGVVSRVSSCATMYINGDSWIDGLFQYPENSDECQCIHHDNGENKVGFILVLSSPNGVDVNAVIRIKSAKVYYSPRHDVQTGGFDVSGFNALDCHDADGNRCYKPITIKFNTDFSLNGNPIPLYDTETTPGDYSTQTSFYLIDEQTFRDKIDEALTEINDMFTSGVVIDYPIQVWDTADPVDDRRIYAYSMYYHSWDENNPSPPYYKFHIYLAPVIAGNEDDGYSVVNRIQLDLYILGLVEAGSLSILNGLSRARWVYYGGESSREDWCAGGIQLLNDSYESTNFNTMGFNHINTASSQGSYEFPSYNNYSWEHQDIYTPPTGVTISRE